MSTIKAKAIKQINTSSKPELSVIEDKADVQYLTLKTGTAAKLSTKSSGKIGFEIAQHSESKEIYLRLTTNSSAGLFSKKWILVSDIVELLNKNKDLKPFKSSLFKEIISGGSSNNISFTAAILRSDDIGFIKPSEKNLFLHTVSDDLDERAAFIEQLTPITSSISPADKKTK
ncbi:hypothetical protein H4J64_19150 [Colwellia sp. BRX8-2]|uniref:hypothetical protein n=1 Tax=unclassified Colwellia TaxID=196834 RepID=UPI0015F76559|nr:MULTISPECIES: hypothetical protein [unclassified Colwellia]MBA6353410.1 hypothetical protein [Colwellia sp. BRX9-1]MBA6359769.1 hypothetical protein [Colwellia sp. BRX8-6]MBA6368289.1 hypothetical protein [Colwellia sp. BRX8-5]MBA6377331.1 hypothetical protein [Colwellia sp. BRX8-2]